MDRVLFDDLDWSGSDQSPATTAVPTSPEPAPPPEPAPREPRRSETDGLERPGTDLLPKAYKDWRPRQPAQRPARKSSSFDDLDFGDLEVEPRAGSRYDPSSDYAITRGIKAGFTGGTEAIHANLDMARIATLSPEEQVKEMLKPREVDPEAAQLQVEGITDIGGVGDVFTYMGESIGQMLGSWGAAAVEGGGAGAVTGAAIGGTAGAVGAGVGAAPGAVAGAVTGAGYGTYAGFMAMGTGGMWQDLLADEGVRKGLQDGSITPDQIYKWALGGGAVIGILDAIPAGRRFTEMTGIKEGAKEAVKKKLREAVKEGIIRGAVEEGVTEGAQGAISELGQAIAGGDTNIGERALSVLNQAAAGAIGGGAAGGVSGAAGNERIPETVQPAPPAGGRAPEPPEGGGGGAGGPGTGAGDKPPPPAGASTRPAEPVVEQVPETGVSSDLAAATTEGYELEEEGEFGAAPAAPLPSYEKPAAQPRVRKRTTVEEPVLDPDISAATGAAAPATPAAPQPSPPTPTPNVPPAAAAPPIGQLPPSDIGRTGMSAMGEPGIPAPTGLSQTEGLPNYGQPEAEEVPEPPSGPPVEAPAPPPDVSLQPPAEPIPVEIAQPDLEAQIAEQSVSRETKAARATRIAKERAEAKRVAPIRDYASRLTSVPSDIEDGARRMLRLDEADRQTFLEAMTPEVSDAVALRAQRLQSVRPVQMAPARQPEQPQARAEKVARVVERGKARARPRPSVALKLPKQLVHALKPAVTTTTRTERLTPKLYGSAVLKHGAATVHKMLVERGVARNKKSKRRHEIVRIAESEKGVVEATLRGAGKKGAPLQVPVDELAERYDIDISGVTTERTTTPIPLPQPSQHERFAYKARQHFKVAKAKAVKLSPTFTDSEIKGLEDAGMAEDGTMDAAEFARWDAHRRGPAVPVTGRPSTAKPMVEEGYGPEERIARLQERLATRGERKTEAEVKEDEAAEKQRKAEEKEEREVEAGKAGWQGRFKPRTQEEPRAQPEIRPPATRPAKGPRQFKLSEEEKKAVGGWKARRRAPEQPLREAIEATERPGVPLNFKRAVAARVARAELAAARQAAPRKAAPWTAGKKMPTLSQGELYRRVDEAFKDAEAAFVQLEKMQSEENEQKVEAAHAEAMKWWAKYEAEKVRRTGALSGKSAAAIAKEDPNTTRRLAHKEAELAKKHPVGRDKNLLEIARLYRELVTLGKSKANENSRRARHALIAKAQARRIAAQKLEDRRQLVESRREGKELERERLVMARQEQQLVKAGLLEPSELESRTEARAAEIGLQYKRLQRSRITGPALRRVIRATELPGLGEKVAQFKEPKSAQQRGRRLAQIVRARKRLEEEGPKTAEERKRTTYQKVYDWARAFVAEAEAAVAEEAAKAPPVKEKVRDPETGLVRTEERQLKVQLPKNPSQRFNTLEENVLIFMKKVIGKKGWNESRRQQAERLAGAGVPTAEGREVQRKVEGYKIKGKQLDWRQRQAMEVEKGRFKGGKRKPDEETIRKYTEPERTEEEVAAPTFNALEAYTIMQLMKEGDAENIYGMMFEEGKTGAVAKRGQGLSQKASEQTFRAEQRAKSMAEVEDVEAISPRGAVVEEAGMTDVVRAETVEEMTKRLRSAWGIDYMAAPEGKFDIEKWLDANDSIKQEVANIIQQVSGLKKTTFASRIPIEDYSPSWGQRIRDAYGAYDFVADTIEISLAAGDMVGAAYHEAYHRLQNLFLTKQQREIHASEEKRLRAIVAKLPGRAEQAAKMSLREIEAEAFRAHAAGKARVPGRLMALWSKLTALVRRTKNYLAGRGYQTSEDIFEAALAGKIIRQPKRDTPYFGADRVAYMASPYSMTGLRDYATSNMKKLVSSGLKTGLKRAQLKLVDNATLNRHVGERFFGGSYENPYSQLNELHLNHERDVEDTMRPGDQLDNEIRRWETVDPRRTETLAEGNAVLANASIDGVDPRKSLADNTWIKAGAAGEYQRARHAEAKKAWDALPAELRDLLSRRADLMSKQMEQYERSWVENWVQSLIDKPTGGLKLSTVITKDIIVNQIMKGKLTPGVEKVLGSNAETIGQIGSLHRRGSLYWPAFRAGEHFISGRRKVAKPTPTHGTVTLDKDAFDNRDIFRWEFTDERDAIAYANEMGRTGKERVTKVQRKFVDPATGDFLPGQQKIVRDAKGNKLRDGVPRYYVGVQDRFMQMSDSVDELNAERERLLATGEYEEIKTPSLMENVRNGSASLAPKAIQRLTKNVDTMEGMDAQQREIIKHAITNSWIQSQQGNRITKKLMKRRGVHGYEVDQAAFYRSMNSHNEMMSRHIVSLKRIAAMTKARDELDDYVNALRGDQKARAKLSAERQGQVDRDYAKHEHMAAERLGEYVRELNQRIDGSMQPRRSIKWMQATQSLTTLAYLGSGSYYAIQILGAVQSFQNMAAKHGAGRAFRMMLKAYSDLGAPGMWKEGGLEGWAEAKELFGPGSEFHKTGLFRESKNFVDEAVDRINASGTTNKEAKIAAIRRAERMGYIGQAGLDQPNIRADNIEGGLKNRIYANLEAATRVFRGLQEGIETVNRAAPLMAYVDINIASGMSEAEAINRAITSMVNEQTGYQRGNWHPWMDSPLAKLPLMFKKFAITQAIMFYGSVGKALGPNSTREERIAGARYLAYTAGAMVLLGGLSGEPWWEPARMLLWIANMFGLADDKTWGERKMEIEAMLADNIGDTAAETLMYGLPRLAGFDISGRVAQDNLIMFNQPEEMSRDAWYQALGESVGAPFAMGADAIASLSSIREETVPKWLSGLPFPKVIKDTLKTVDDAMYGPRTATGVSTGVGPDWAEGLTNMFGFRTRRQTRPYEQGSAIKYTVEKRLEGEKNALIRRAATQGIAAVRDDVRAWNKAHPDQKVTISSIVKSKKRLRQAEKDIRKANVEAL